MQTPKQQIMTLLQEKRLVKVITGIDNHDLEQVARVTSAATQAQAGAVDVAADKAVIETARANTTLPVFASAVRPQALADALAWGADAVEIGNFDALYQDGFYLSAEDVLKLTEDTLALVPQGTVLSVTVPGHLTQDAQVRLAQRLETMGVAMLQTEGASRVVTLEKTVEVLCGEDKLRLTLENTRALSQAVRIPVMTASGIAPDNVREAFAAGASAVGVGSAVNKLASQAQMIEVLTALMAQVEPVKASQVS